MSQLRQLAAIMFTDIVGYTSLMGEDERRAFHLLNLNRELQKPIIEQYKGRWIKELGDGVMATFTTVSDAVQAAMKIQEACKAANKFQLRIGIHLGEVVFENDDVFGDGVNIAARIQSAAAPGSIYISESVYQNISNKSDYQARFVREELLKNVKQPVRTYEVMAATIHPDMPASVVAATQTHNSKKSIAVLPFVNMSNDPEQEYFCDGITEEIINALAQLNNLRVVARTSAFSFKGKNVDVREIGKLLDVKTLLEGSVRKSGNRLRITTQLVHVDDGAHLWSSRYDRVCEDVFAIQEDIAEKVASAMEVYLTLKEKEALRRPETIIEAYESFLKGRQLLHMLALEESKAMFEKAIDLDPGYAPAYAGLSDLHCWLYEWHGASQDDLDAANRYSLKALSLAPDLSESHSSHGYVLALSKRYDEAEAEFKKAAKLNPNSYEAYYFCGRTCFARGKIRESADMFHQAGEVRREDVQSKLLEGQSLRVLGDERAVEVTRDGINRARKQLELNPNDRRALSLTSINLWEMGEKEEALTYAERALSLYPDDVGVLVNSACFYAVAGNKEKSLDLLEKVFGRGFGKKDWIEHDPDYDSLRDEPRFKALLSKLQ